MINGLKLVVLLLVYFMDSENDFQIGENVFCNQNFDPIEYNVRLTS